MDIRLSELVSALSHALDVTGGQPMGHAERTCLIGQRLADAVGLESAQRSSLFYALLLKDAGCSTTAAQIATTFGSDDLQVKRESRLIDTQRPRTALGYLRRNVAPGASLRERARHLRAVMAMSHGGVDELERDVCFWASLEMPDVQAVEPADRVLRADDAGLDRVAEAFAGIVDAKSPYTARHCEGVAEIADGIAATMGLDHATRRLLRRAALLHDLGKLGVSNRILDKPGPLTDGEWSAVRRHPRLSMIILRAVPALAPVGRLSATHHERLDGSGYPYGLTASELKLPDRVLQVADVTDALTSERPYRQALSPDEGLAIMRYDAGKRLDADAFAAVESWLPHRPSRLTVVA